MTNTDTTESLKLTSQLAILLCSCFIGPGIIFADRTPASVQTYFLRPPCLNASANACCADCLGVSASEYALTEASLTWLAAIIVFYSGAIIDFFGIPFAMALTTSEAFIGGLLSAVAPYVVHQHAAVLICMSLGRLFITIATYNAMTFLPYMAIRFFQPKWRSLVISVNFSCSAIGAVGAGFVIPRVAQRWGFKLALWALAVSTATSVVFAGALWLLFRCSEDIRRFEAASQKDPAVVRPRQRLLQSIKAFKLDYWLILLIISLSSSSMFTYMSNLPLIQTSLFDISIIDAPFYMSIGRLVDVLVCPPISWLLSRARLNFLLSFVALAMQAAAFLLLIVPHGSPVASSIFVILPFTLSNVCLTPLICSLVPSKALGLASSIIQSANIVIYGLCSLMVGWVLNGESVVQSARNAVFVLLGVWSVQAVLLAAVTWRLKWRLRRRRRKEEGEGEEEVAEPERPLTAQNDGPEA